MQRGTPRVGPHTGLDRTAPRSRPEPRSSWTRGRRSPQAPAEHAQLLTSSWRTCCFAPSLGCGHLPPRVPSSPPISRPKTAVGRHPNCRSFRRQTRSDELRSGLCAVPRPRGPHPRCWRPSGERPSLAAVLGVFHLGNPACVHERCFHGRGAGDDSLAVFSRGGRGGAAPRWAGVPPPAAVRVLLSRVPAVCGDASGCGFLGCLELGVSCTRAVPAVPTAAAPLPSGAPRGTNRPLVSVPQVSGPDSPQNGFLSFVQVG